ncbi:formate dehydrogenase subunit delta [Thalassotalea psychrophila]|uniref:Formate dehydrogenase subunit delta n=1 Tax=Thalassotalea psychrophila TaxID=3065647 RepID=A0ABY9TRX6_9GAMM|nr:formate dehydrogenase subunit delta [Colwelliaceae bacterium SQ149]
MTIRLNSIIKMCNQISDNIGHHLTPIQAADKVVNHLTLFWAKSMKAQLIQYYQNDGAELNDISKLAVEKLSQ